MADANVDGARNETLNDARLVKVASRDYEKAVRVPSAFVEERARVSTAAYEAWHEARLDPYPART